MTRATSHLNSEELQRWRDDPSPADRDRIVSHLAVCDACGSRYAEMVRTSPAAEIDATLSADAFRERGYAVYGGRRPWFLAFTTLAPLTAAAAVLIAVGVYLLAPDRTPSMARGGGAAADLLRPSRATVAANELRFEWTVPEGTTRQSLTVVDLSQPDEPVISRDDVRPGYVPTAEERLRLKPGVTYRWFVECRTATGATAVSPSATFSIR